MRRQEGIAGRYAKALFLVAREGAQVRPVGDQLAGFADVAVADRRLAEFLSRPWLKGAAKRAVATAVAQRLGAGRLVTDFLGLLARRGRLDLLPAIARVYRDLEDQAQGRIRARVRSAVPLGEGERATLAARLGRVVGKEVMLEVSEDPTLLGGFVAQIGSLQVDGSLDGQLARMRERLMRG